MRTTAKKIYGLMLLFTISLTGLAQKTDKVCLKNGDTLTGEIKNLKFAKLSFDMSGPGTISIKWEFIVSIRSDKVFLVTMRSGTTLITVLDSLPIKLPMYSLDDIVEIITVKDKFLKRLDGDANLGFNYNKSNQIFQFVLNGSVNYRQPKLETGFKLNSVLSHDASNTTQSRKQDATVDIYKRLNKMIYINTLTAWQENTELGLDNRFLVSVAAGKIFINNNRRRFLTGSGLSYNLEQFTGSKSYQGNLEAMLALQFKEFHYSTPKISLDSKLIFFAGLTDWGRVRLDFQINSKFEIFKDFNIGLSFYDNLDSDPPANAASKNDFGVNLTMGYEFGK